MIVINEILPTYPKDNHCMHHTRLWSVHCRAMRCWNRRLEHAQDAGASTAESVGRSRVQELEAQLAQLSFEEVNWIRAHLSQPLPTHPTAYRVDSSFDDLTYHDVTR